MSGYESSHHYSNHIIDWYPPKDNRYGKIPPIEKIPKNPIKIASPYITYSYGAKAANYTSSGNMSRSGGDFSNPNKVFGG